MTQAISVKNTDVFVTRIWTFDLTRLLSEKVQWLQVIADMRAANPEAAGRSNRLGWNSNKELFSMPEFKLLADYSKRCMNYAFADLKVPVTPEGGYGFDVEAWVNLGAPGAYNMKHSHPNAMLSACFYLELPKGSGDIMFYEPRPGAVYCPLKMDGQLGSRNISLSPQTGQLIVFPNYLEHAVFENEGVGERISIAMHAYRSV